MSSDNQITDTQRLNLLLELLSSGQYVISRKPVGDRLAHMNPNDLLDHLDALIASRAAFKQFNSPNN